MTLLRGRTVPIDLRRWVQGTWVFRADANGVEQTAADDATSFVVQLAPELRAFVCGPEPSSRSIIGVPRSLLVGVRLRAGALATLFDIPGSVLSGRMGWLDNLVAPAVYRQLLTRVTPDVDATFDVVFDFIRAFVIAPRGGRLDRVERALDVLSHGHAGTLDALVRELETTERTLRRTFVEAVGLGPKLFTRVRRFRRAAEMLPTTQTLAGLALETGFADQAHMTREFVALSGLTPGAVRRAAMPFVPGSLR